MDALAFLSAAASSFILSGDFAPLLPVPPMKWEKSSVCLSKKSNRLPEASEACGGAEDDASAGVAHDDPSADDEDDDDDEDILVGRDLLLLVRVAEPVREVRAVVNKRAVPI